MCDTSDDVNVDVVTPSKPAQPSFSSLQDTITQHTLVREENPNLEKKQSEREKFPEKIKQFSHSYTETKVSGNFDETVGVINGLGENLSRQQVPEICSHEELSNVNMGNQNSRKVQQPSDEDTPDESRTKCCEIPKKKIKDRNSRTSRSSRGDENDFEADEVYPFESRTRSDQDLNEPVELEPFEIIDTDDIKFVAGAGTSDVIRNVSESKFKTIPEEECFEDDTHGDHEDLDQTEVKQPVSIDSNDRFLESGTTTAHSTFEFQQVKAREKFKKKIAKEPEEQHIYENIDKSNEDEDRITEERSTISDESVKTGDASPLENSDGSNKSSENVSRKNSKEAITKPVRQSKVRKRSEDDKIRVVLGTKLDETSDSLTIPVRSNETSGEVSGDKDEKMIILTQTMFSKPKRDDTVPDRMTSSQTENIVGYENVNLSAEYDPSIGISIKKGEKDRDKNVPVGECPTKYENVNVCAKFEPAVGISIGHNGDTKAQDSSSTKKNIFRKIEGVLPEEQLTLAERSQIMKEKFLRDEREIAESKLTDIPVFRQRPKSGCSSDENSSSGENKNVKSCLLDRMKLTKNAEVGDEKLSLPIESSSESVPPPSPTAMDILQEEEEEEEDEDEDEVEDYVLDEDDRRRSAEIVEFTEHVCKRLSQLLEVMPIEEEDQEDPTDMEHTYENLNSVSKKKSDSVHKTVTPKGYESAETVLAGYDELSANSSIKKTVHRSNAPVSVNKKRKDSEDNVSSEDDLPEYFDPRTTLPKRDSEILCDVLDAYSEDVTEVPAEEIQYIIESNPLSFEATGYDNVQCMKVDKPESLDLKSYNVNMLDSAPIHLRSDDIQEKTPTAEANVEFTPLPQNFGAEGEVPIHFDTYGRHSVTCTESDLDISEHRDDLSTDSMLADDEDEETMEILFTKTYTEPVEGGEVFLSCTVVNSAYKEEKKESETWLSDEALEYLEANAADVMSTAFMKAKKEMKDIQLCLQSLREQMEHFHGDCDDISLPDIPVNNLSPDYFGLPRKAVTD